MCVGSVCTHPSYNDKNPPSGFWKSPFSNQAVLRVLSEWRSSVQAPPTRVDWQDRFTLAPRVSWELSPIAGEDKLSQTKRLRRLVVGCDNEYSSHHLLPKSEPLKTQRIKFVFEGNAPPIYLNASMFMRIIRGPASPTAEVSIRTE